MVEVSALPEVDDGFGGEDAEVIVLTGPQVAVGAEQHAHFVLGLGEMLLAAGLGDHADAVAAAVGLEVAFDRDHDEVVLRVAEDAAQRFGRADHFVGAAFDLDELADGVAAFEEARAHIVAEEDDGGVAADLFVGDAAADVDLDVVDGRDVFGDALDIDAEGGVALVGYAGLAGRHHADVLDERGAVLDELVLVRPDLRIALLHFHELLGIPRTEPGHAHDAETVRTHVGDLLGDIEVHAVDEGGDGDQRSGGENDSEQGEEAAQLVFAQRIDGDPGGFPERRRKAEFSSFGHWPLWRKTELATNCSRKVGDYFAPDAVTRTLRK